MSTACSKPPYDTRELLVAHQTLAQVPGDQLARLVDLARPFVLAEKVIQPNLVAELATVMPHAPAAEIFAMVKALFCLARAQSAVRKKS